MQDRGWSEGDVLRQLRPEDLPACYGVIWIEPYSWIRSHVFVSGGRMADGARCREMPPGWRQRAGAEADRRRKQHY